MIAGHLQEKKGLYYMVLSYKDKSGKRVSKWLPTGLPVKGNKKRAEDMLMAARAEFVAGEAAIDRDMPFSSYLVQWMEIARSTLKPNTAAGYASMIQNPIAPYFQQRGITLGGLQAVDIQMFYTSQLKRVSANTVIHYHAIIHRALKYAVKTDLIDVNPADKVERPRKDRFTASFYDGNEVNRLFQAARGTPLELPVMLAAFYGLRRSEVVGLKWDAIDFENKTIAIRHTVTACAEKGRRIEVAADTTKTASSRRTLPLVPAFQTKLAALKEQQEKNRILCGRSYCTDYLGYVLVDAMGNRLKLSYISTAFPALLKRNGLRPIRFHDLRHSCASLLLKNGVPMKQIQEWLGPSDFSKTANIYADLAAGAKLTSAQAMEKGLGLRSEALIESGFQETAGELWRETPERMKKGFPRCGGKP